MGKKSIDGVVSKRKGFGVLKVKGRILVRRPGCNAVYEQKKGEDTYICTLCRTDIMLGNIPSNPNYEVPYCPKCEATIRLSENEEIQSTGREFHYSPKI